MKRSFLLLALLIPTFTSAQELNQINYRSPEGQQAVIDAFVNFFKQKEATKPNVSVTISLSPQAIAPLSSTTAYARSSGEAIGDALVVWYQNGKEVRRGRGLSSYTFQTREVGTQEVIEVSVTFSSTAIKTARVVAIPASVRFLWETNAITPPWFKGGSLATPGSRITIRAYPTIISGGTTLNRSSLRYDWELNRSPLRSMSGVGQDTISIDAGTSAGITQNVTVSVSSLTGTVSGRGNIAIPVQLPELKLYQQLSLLGIVLERSVVRTNADAGKSITLRAVPFYAPPALGDFTWSAGSTNLASSDDPYALTVRIPESGKVSQQFRATLSYPKFFSRTESLVTVESN